MLTKRLRIVPPRTREAIRLTFVMWLAVYIILGPVTWLTGQVTGLAEFLSILTAFATSFLFALLLSFLIRRVSGQPVWLALPALAAAVTVVAIMQMAADYGGQYLLHISFVQHRMPDASPQAQLMVGSIYWVLDACNLALLWVSSAARKIRMDEVELAHARAAKLEAQLNMLRMQINPHFMCNSLNVVSGLIIAGRTAEAERMTGKLAEFLRVSSEIEGLETALGDELALILSYLEVETARFEDRLEIEIGHNDEIARALVPNFILQPLVENALKYGVQYSRGLAKVRIIGRRDGDRLILTVENEAEEAIGDVPETNGGGIGLANIRARLALIFGSDACLESEPLRNGYRATINLPFRQGPARAAPLARVPVAVH
ncbi:sensor histidine kinase [Allosphingosinicella vermicomposti]|uniref:sensor histidine kinase n=1 Tax=Allosphingosinicella vermicomposti TaxID=614671 RepID=UPI000D0F2B1B|nr:histidine kinase [Allosphingosinicella vermicomposti]